MINGVPSAWWRGYKAQKAADRWKCFHCDRVFTDFPSASEHFGSYQSDAPLCTADQLELIETRKERDRYADENVRLRAKISEGDTY